MMFKEPDHPIYAMECFGGVRHKYVDVVGMDNIYLRQCIVCQIKEEFRDGLWQ